MFIGPVFVKVVACRVVVATVTSQTFEKPGSLIG